MHRSVAFVRSMGVIRLRMMGGRGVGLPRAVRVPGLGARLAAAWLSVAVLCPLVPLASGAQAVDDVRVEDDNGQLDFWLPPRRRPDTELTNAALAHLVIDGTAGWGWLMHRPACALASATASCATTDLEFGQEMYTPAGATQSPTPRVGARPYAGWLYLAGTARVATTSRSDAITIEAGVTGSPSFAAQVQTAWHDLIGYPRALGWSHQIPFQPGVLIAVQRDAEVAHLSIHGVPVLSIIPQAGMSVGNVLTGAHVGAEMHLGYGVSTPWSSSVHGRGRPIELYALAGAREDLIAYQMFLDQGTTNPVMHVAKEPTVFQYDFGIGARFGAFELEYRGITRGREYLTGPPLHPYGTLAVGIRSTW